MLIWTACIFCALGGFHLLMPRSLLGLIRSGTRDSSTEIRKILAALHELQELLESGILPSEEKWAVVRGLPSPWGPLLSESILGLRAQGAAILPTIRRFRDLAVHHRDSLSEAKARSAQALMQALVCTALVPLFGAGLFMIMPGLEEHPWLWVIACTLAILLSLAGAFWLLSMAEEARWGGMPPAQRSWILISQCAGERLLSSLRSGDPPDIAWGRACEFLAREAPGLAEEWGFSTWKSECGSPEKGTVTSRPNSPMRPLIDAGHSLKKAIQISLMEGRSCMERAEAILAAMRTELRMQTERELSVLGARALKPLFVCTAPALLGLLGMAMVSAWLSLQEGGVG